MTSVEQRKMIQRLKPKTVKMKPDERRAFEMMAKRDHDDEDLDSLSMVKLKKIYEKFYPSHSKNEIENKWNTLTGGGNEKKEDV